LVHHKKNAIYANISFSVYPEGPSMVDLLLDQCWSSYFEIVISY